MGTENEQMTSQASDMASSDSDYDTDLETEGNRKKKSQFWYEDEGLIGSAL